jgi:ribosome biogenesis GTPase
VRAALESGALDPGRWAGYRKLRAEAAALARRQDPRAAAEARKTWVARAKEARAHRRDKG